MSPPKLLAEPEKPPVHSKAHQLLGPLDGQHAQQHLVEEREDRRIGADAQSQRQHHGSVKPGDLRNWRSA